MAACSLCEVSLQGKTPLAGEVALGAPYHIHGEEVLTPAEKLQL